MAKPKKKRIQPAGTAKAQATPVQSFPSIFPWTFKIKCYILITIGFLFYANSLLNEYAHDDKIAILQNDFVKEGFGGIGKILTSDAYASFYNHMHADPRKQYSGGRYRPLCYITFAIEHAIFGESAFVRHLANVLAYMLCLVTVFYFLNYFLLKNVQGGGDVAFLSVLLFAIHPIHTEVVANIKSMDEILSLTLIMATFIFSLTYLSEKKIKHLALGMFCLFLAFLAKEYAITLIVLLPLLFYLVGNKKPFDAFTASLPYFGVAVIYLIIRINAVGSPHSLPANDPLVDPFLYATHSQKLATECYALGRYMIMFLFPYPLSSDYSYAEIPYRSFSDISVWLSIFLFLGITYWAFTLFRKKSVMAFPILFFLACIALISNFVIELGAIFGERLLFHSSLAFLVILSYYGLNYIKKWPVQKRKNFITAILAGLVLVCGAETVTRNAQWKNDDTLFIHDVFTCPNSCLLNNNAGWCYLGMYEAHPTDPHSVPYLDSAKKYLKRAIAINSKYVSGYENLIYVYYHFGMPDSANSYLAPLYHIYNGPPPSINKISNLLAKQYIDEATALGGQHKPAEAIKKLKKGLALDSVNADVNAQLWDNIGGAYYTMGQWDSARYAWNKTLQIEPSNIDASRGLQALPKPNILQ